eukprot:Filipodium_phascolosomae@DN2618_c0_g1_i8.p1
MLMRPEDVACLFAPQPIVSNVKKSPPGCTWAAHLLDFGRAIFVLLVFFSCCGSVVKTGTGPLAHAVFESTAGAALRQDSNSRNSNLFSFHLLLIAARRLLLSKSKSS